MKTPLFPCKYHQKGGFSTAMLVLGRVSTMNFRIRDIALQDKEQQWQWAKASLR